MILRNIIIINTNIILSLIIKTTNLDTYISSEINIKSGEDGAICIPVMKLNEILSALPDCELNFSISQNGKVTISGNLFKKLVPEN